MSNAVTVAERDSVKGPFVSRGSEAGEVSSTTVINCGDFGDAVLLE